MIKDGVRMKRDMDLIRKMLLAIEADEHGFAPKIEIDGYTQGDIGYHAVLLGEAGLAIVSNITTFGAKSPQAIVNRLTWEGHEFLDASRENQIWIAVLTTLIQKKLGF